MRPSVLLAVALFAAFAAGCQKAAAPTEAAPQDAPTGAPTGPPAKAIEPAFTLKTPYAGTVGDGITEISVTANGRHLAVSGYVTEKSIQIWDLETKQVTAQYETGSKGPHAHLFPDGSRMLLPHTWSDVVVRDVRTGEKKGELVIPRSDADGGVIADMRISADGALALAITSRRVLGWDASGKLAFEWLAPNELGSLSRFFASGKRIAVGGKKGAITIWDVNQKKAVQNLTLPGEGEVDSVAVSSDGAYLAARSGTSASTTVVVWDLRSGQIVHEFEKYLFMPGSEAMLFLPDNKTLVYADAGNALVLFDVPAKAARYRHAGVSGHSGNRMQVMDIPATGAILIVGYENGTIKVFDLKALQ